ncbi:MAG: acyl-CoA dehydrogenase family protein [Acidimicrobiia bacterium]
MVGVDALLVETVERLLTASSTFDAVEQAEADGWCAPVWDALSEAGFPWISIAEDAGGSGGSLADAMAVLRSVGRHASPVPVAETGVLGGWLAAAAGFEIPTGPTSVVPDPGALVVERGRIRGETTVAWARQATRVLALVQGADGPVIVSATPDQLDVEPRTNMAGEPRDLVRFDCELADLEHAPAPPGVDGDELRRRGCLTRIGLSAGALETLCQLTIDYTNERRQFGRPIAAFQAVQHHLVTIAQASVRASMAADVATRALTGGDARFEVAAARVVVDAAAVDATRAAHQAHGAMGVTREYRLHHFSRRLWAWRHEYGGVKGWRRALGADVASAGANALFPTVSR